MIVGAAPLTSAATGQCLCAGEALPDAAAQALQALLIDKKAAHRITLRRTRSDGMHAWTLFEMWPATVSLTGSMPVLPSVQVAAATDAAAVVPITAIVLAASKHRVNQG